MTLTGAATGGGGGVVVSDAYKLHCDVLLEEVPKFAGNAPKVCVLKKLHAVVLAVILRKTRLLGLGRKARKYVPAAKAGCAVVASVFQPTTGVNCAVVASK